MTCLFSVMPWRSGGIVAPPAVERIDVEVLTVEVDALLGEELVDVVDEPIPGLGIAEVQEPPFARRGSTRG